MKRSLEPVDAVSWASKALKSWAAPLLIGGSLVTTSCMPRHEFCPSGETCEEPADDPLPGVQSCDLHGFADSPIGQCIPYVDGGWHTSLVKMSYAPKHQLHCPGSFAGFFGVEIPVDATPPRNVIGCTVQPLATCSSLSYACVPFAEGYDACIHQADEDECLDPYPLETMVERDGDGGLITVCCRGPERPG